MAETEAKGELWYLWAILKCGFTGKLPMPDKAEPISNDLINVQEEMRLLNDLNEVIDKYRDGRVTRVQVIGILYLIQQEMIAEAPDDG